jgi:hypothetical protein
MPRNVPHSVVRKQPPSVLFGDYRLRMADSIKALVARKVMARIRALEGAPDLDRTRCETALRRRGMQPGNAQRLLDDTSDVQLKRLEEAARLLEVSIGYFFDVDTAATVTTEPWPLRRISPQEWAGLDPYERGAIESAAARELEALRAARPPKQQRGATR